MAPSWVRSLQDHAGSSLGSRVPPELEHANWSGGMAESGVRSPGSGAAMADIWAEGLLASLALPGEVCAMAVEPIMGYLAVATTAGTVHLFGSPAVQQISFALRPALKVKFLLFKPGSSLLISIDDKDNMSVYDLSRVDPAAKAKATTSNPFQPPSTTSAGGNLHPDTPARIAAYTARNAVTCVEVSPAHSHLFLGLRDGTVDCFDLERLSSSPYRIPNLGYEEEEIQRRSGVPDAPSRRHVPLVVNLATHPKDVNQLLLAYEGAVVLMDIKERAVLSTYQMRLLPGAPGAGGDPATLWTERAPPVTCVAWRPDGLVFAVGHEDGLISFWQTGDDEKPLTVRSLDREHVDRKSEAFESDPAFLQPFAKEPVFKLAWASIPRKSWLDRAADVYGAAGAAWQKHQEDQPMIPAPKAAQPSPESAVDDPGSILTVLGGAVDSRDPSGLTLLHYAPYSPSTSFWGAGTTPVEIAQRRKQLADSVDARRVTKLFTPSTVEDFLLIPKDSPHYSMASDPVAVITLLAADPSLPPLPPPAAARGLQAYRFPSRPASSAPGGPKLSETMDLPYSLSCTGSGAVLGAKLLDLGSAAYNKLVGRIEPASNAGMSTKLSAAMRATEASEGAADDTRLPLSGGKACPTVTGRPATSVQELVKAKHYRIIVTWHKDGSVRFTDVSSHLLLGQPPLPRPDGSVSIRFLDSAFPTPLPRLTISTHAILRHPAMVGHPLFDRFRAEPVRIRIKDVQLAPEVLEVGIALATGQLMHFHFGFARFSETAYVNEEVERDVRQDELAAASAVSPLSSGFGRQPTSPLSGEGAGQQALDSSMAGAMSDLGPNVGGTHSPHRPQHPRTGSTSSATFMGPPPSRPPRDPKRLVDRPAQASEVHSGASTPRFDHAYARSPLPPPTPMPFDDVTPIEHLAVWSSDGFKPKTLVDLRRGEINAFAVSDVGFVAVAYGTAWALLDLRGPDFLLRDGFGDGSDTTDCVKLTREMRKAAEAESRSPISQLNFSICRVAEDPSLALRVVVVRESGLLSLWTLSMTLDIWLCERTIATSLPELASPVVAPLIVDAAGNLCPATPGELQRSLRVQSRVAEYQPGDIPSLNLLICISRQTVSVRYGVTGIRMSKADIGEEVLSAHTVQYHSDKALVIATAASFHVYTLPRLTPITRLQRHSQHTVERAGTPVPPASVHFDAHGDLIEVASSLDVRLWTVTASIPRPGPPALQLFTPGWLPPHPGAGVGGVASSLSNWLGKPTLFASGAQIDEVLAGPRRPPIPNLPEVRPPLEVQQISPDVRIVDKSQKSTNNTTSRLAAAASVQARKSERPTERLVYETNATRDQARQNIDAAQMRGEAMSNLEEGLSSLEKGARDFLNSTRQNMVMGAAKGKITSLFK